jgi:hypothetical protein
MKRFIWTLIRGIGCCERRVSALLDGVVKGRGEEERRGGSG